MGEGVEKRCPWELQAERRQVVRQELNRWYAVRADGILERAGLRVPERLDLAAHQEDDALVRQCDVGGAEAMPAWDRCALDFGLLRCVACRARCPRQGPADRPAEEEEALAVLLVLTEVAGQQRLEIASARPRLAQAERLPAPVAGRLR